jgi:hypothetical protein
MAHQILISFLFRFWIKLHHRPFRLSEARPLWREARRFARERC